MKSSQPRLIFRVAMLLGFVQLGTFRAEAKVLPVSSFTSVEQPDFTAPEHPTIHLEGKGMATNLGAFTVVFNVALDPKTLAVSGKFDLDMGSGNKLSGTVGGGASTTANPDQLSIVNPLNITTGTGNFAHASGTLTVRRILDKNSGASIGSIEGTVSIPGN